jgi:hypothetical protein
MNRECPVTLEKQPFSDVISLPRPVHPRTVTNAKGARFMRGKQEK